MEVQWACLIPTVSILEELRNEDAMKWPSIKFGNVYTYLIETRGPFTKDKLGHTNLIICYSGQKTFQAGSVGRLNNDNDSHMISGCHLCVAEDLTHILVSSAKVFISRAKHVRL